jgi:plastocyanin
VADVERARDGGSRRRNQLLVGGAVVAVAAVAGVLLVGGDDDDGEGGGSRSDSTEVTSGLSPGSFTYPSEVRGRVGEETVFVNDDTVPHTFTSDDGLFDSGTLQEGEELSIATLPAGEYGYHCSIHPDLTGTLTIE